jgi:hypothetical protein
MKPGWTAGDGFVSQLPWLSSESPISDGSSLRRPSDTRLKHQNQTIGTNIHLPKFPKRNQLTLLDGGTKGSALSNIVSKA